MNKNIISKNFQSVDFGLIALQKSRIKFDTKAVNRLEEAEVTFVRIVEENGAESYTALYKGEELVPKGSAQDLRRDEIYKELDLLHNEMATTIMIVAI